MTDEDALTIYNAMLEHFGELPNFEHEPLRFAAYVKMFKYYKSRELTIPQS